MSIAAQIILIDETNILRSIHAIFGKSDSEQGLTRRHSCVNCKALPKKHHAILRMHVYFAARIMEHM